MSNTTPASGERRSAGGLRPQYAVAAAAALEALRGGDLVEVRVTDPEAGATDDAIIVREHRVDAYQVKWARYPGTITLLGLTSDKDGPSLIAQLADGWQRLRVSHPTRRVVVHLLTNDVPSSSKKIADDPTPGHLAAFLAEAWEPARVEGTLNFDGPWAEPWAILKDASGLDEKEFASFVDDCALDVASPVPPEDADHQALATLLFQTAAAVRYEVGISRRDLLSRLGWTRRFAPLNRHEFDVPRFYRPIERTADAVRRRLADLPGGYLAIVGPPGSGKSTLLTRTLLGLRVADQPVRLIRYYAFVRDTQGATALRGESAHFLHDVTLSLQDAGIGRANRRPEPADRSALLALFHGQLAELAREHKETGTRTVFLIDGLDHIEREQDPVRSLLRDLPLPNEVPGGVYLVLGSQRTDLGALPPSVSREVRDDSRRVEMARLTPGDISGIACEVVPGVTDDEVSRIAERSAGHPLALIYLLRRLGSAGSEDRAAILDAAVPYADDIEAHYDAHWQLIVQDAPIVRALALLARTRGPIDAKWMLGWMGQDTARRLERWFGPYFERDGANRLSFFHNSFRLFLESQTSQPPFGVNSATHAHSLHKELAQLYATASTPPHPDALYHLVEAEEDAEAVALATTDFFLAQVRALRPLEAVQADVRFATLAAGRSDDALALVRLLLIAADLEQRTYILEDGPIADFLLDLGEPALASESIRDGDRLRVSASEAIDLSVRLADADLSREGVHVYELATPYATLSGAPLTEYGSNDEWDSIRAWADAAPRFLQPSEAIALVLQVQVGLDVGHDEDAAAHANRTARAAATLQAELFCRLATTAASRQAWRDWRAYLRAYLTGGHNPCRLLFDSANAVSDVNPDASRRLVDMVLKRCILTHGEDDLPQTERRLKVAELALAHRPEASAEWTADLLPLPFRSQKSVGIDRKPSRAAVRLRLYRIRFALGDARELRILVDADAGATEWLDHHDEDDRAHARRIALAISTIGASWGQAQRGDCLPTATFLREAGWIVDALDNEGHLHMRFHETQTSRAEIFGWLACAAAAHGVTVASAVLDRLVSRWEDGRGYPNEARSVGVALAEVGERDLARRALAYAGAGSESDVWSRVGAEQELAEAYIMLNDFPTARQHLVATFDAARGTLDKHDYQLEGWVSWMGQANAVDPAGAEERVRPMLRRVVAARDQSRSARDAARELIAVVTRWSPRRAVPILIGLLERGVIDHNEGLLALLRGAMDSPAPPIDAVLHTIRHLAIPLGGPGESGTVAALLSAVAVAHGHDDATRAARYLTDGVRAEAIRSSRSDWLRSIAVGLAAIEVPLSAAGITPEDIVRDDTKDEYLVLSDGRRLTFAEALDAINSGKDFERLAALYDAKASTLYRWMDLGKRAIRLASLDEIERLASAFETVLSGLQTAIALVSLSDRAKSFDQDELAGRLVQRALALSDPMGWDPHYDGGSRLAAFEALKRADPKAGRLAALACLSEDIGRGRRGVSPHRLIHHAERVFPLLFVDVPVLDVWRLIEQYLDELFASTPQPPVTEAEERLDKLGPAPDDDTSARAVADVVTAYLDIPSPNIAARAVAAIASTLTAQPNDPSWAAALIEAVNRSEEAASRVLTALVAVSGETPEAVSPFEDLITSLASHPHLFIRSRAAQVRARMHQLPLTVAISGNSLPATYDLELPERPARRDEPAVVLDPAKRLRPLDFDVRSIAKSAGVNEGAALVRASRLAEEFTPERAWLRGDAAISPEQLNSFLDKADLKVSFRKPHIASAERAVAHVAGELYDGNRLPPSKAAFFSHWLTGDDPDLVLHLPQQRPNWVESMTGIGDAPDLYGTPEGWLESAAESLDHLPSIIPSGRAVLAEHVRFAYLGDNERVEEVRSSGYHIGPEDEYLDLDDSWVPFEKVEALRTAHYITFEGRKGPILHAPSRRAETPGMGWIAIAPATALELGWTHDPSGLFRWRDADGEFAVETVWWTDGFVERYDTRTRDIVGEGWAVLASPSAAREFRDRNRRLTRWGAAKRQFGFSGFGEVRTTHAPL